jgi:hypothetical protein
MAGNEKVSPTTSEPEVDSSPAHAHLEKRVITADELHEFRENDGYIIDAENSDGSPSDTAVKLAADGHTRLIPQPSDDPKDPLNWSWRKKHTILFIIAAAAFLPDYGSATGAVTLIPQAAYVETIEPRPSGCHIRDASRNADEPRQRMAHDTRRGQPLTVRKCLYAGRRWHIWYV